LRFQFLRILTAPMRKFLAEVFSKAAVGVASTGIVALVIWLSPSARDIVWNALKAIWIFLIGTVAIPRWIALPAGGFFLWLLFAGTRVWLKSRVGPDWRSYRHDSFFGVTWRWAYEDDGEIINLDPFCPQCDMRLLHTEDWDYSINGQRWRATEFVCENCQPPTVAKEAKPFTDVKRAVILHIDRRLRTGEWRTRASVADT
jgi:hypothetical protein